MGFLGFNFNLKDQLAFYGSYHRAKGNQFIHFVFVPVIMWSAAVWLNYTPAFSDKLDLPAALSKFLPDWLAELYVFNAALLILAMYSIYYIVLEPVAGLSWSLLLALPMIALSKFFQEHVPYAWAWALGGWCLGWYLQIKVGHQMIEKRRPALMDSFFQSLVLAGLFAWMEGLFALGYRPKLQAELHELVAERVKTFDDAPVSQEPLLKEAATS